MTIRVLGCSGGIGGLTGSTCIQLGEHILIDAGSGLNTLSLTEMRAIKHIVLTHAHMDHICSLPTFLANLFDYFSGPIVVHAFPETIQVLKECIFNWQVWPDFTQLPSPENPILAFQEIHPHQAFTIDDYQFLPFSAAHTVPTAALSVTHNNIHFVFSADTKYTEEFVAHLNTLEPIDIFMVECSFPDRYAELAEASCHLTPATVQQTLNALNVPPKEVWISHLKPSYEEELRTLFATSSVYKHWHILK
ncbi:3',5'-cyclic-nucleotide phosphodiesterase [Aliidiomarina taiwanensis]|uniref:3',5'-cyclic-nucleotide phosphodiesterase n=1 Tax=Aliidiomarina taiwanensis TaxID=946228 RepID=A0A432WZZ8_9GAMM|nr:3',5'-cyclic-nucleotide phosphodiesterase [Aliidiomarina taiwanensis]RUO39359.1 3',5'-cyclic-nucleotide phosphodiesterase [Aliidiomarina taiwanensis]